MVRRAMLASIAFLGCGLFFSVSESNAQGTYQQAYSQAQQAPQAPQAQRAYGKAWGGQQNAQDWNRYYHYPYVYYPQNFWGNEYYRSSNSMYHRYPQEMRVPVYNRGWHNAYPSGRRYHWGHHFQLDVF